VIVIKEVTGEPMAVVDGSWTGKVLLVTGTATAAECFEF
jgi:hypothetical protein